ncbi:MAG: hypothetical protein ACRCXX_13985 [Cetobacterium sp.]|uniref:hypothetical protein n=1 Tax=Cetobacterium sp. TaxID=2071632 RepID=UPI003F3FE1FA
MGYKISISKVNSLKILERETMKGLALELINIIKPIDVFNQFNDIRLIDKNGEEFYVQSTKEIKEDLFAFIVTDIVHDIKKGKY